MVCGLSRPGATTDAPRDSARKRVRSPKTVRPAPGAGPAPAADPAAPRGRGPYLVAGAVVAVLFLGVVAWLVLGSSDDSGANDRQGGSTTTLVTGTSNGAPVDLHSVAFVYPSSQFAEANAAMAIAAKDDFEIGTKISMGAAPAQSIIYYRQGRVDAARDLAQLLGFSESVVHILPEPLPYSVNERDSLVVVLGADWVTENG